MKITFTEAELAYLLFAVDFDRKGKRRKVSVSARRKLLDLLFA